jgi:hypothetical protein
MDDMDAGFRDADILYPKSWGCWLTTEDKEESSKIGKKYENWITDERRMSLAKPDAIYMHCLPADRIPLPDLEPRLRRRFQILRFQVTPTHSGARGPGYWRAQPPRGRMASPYAGPRSSRMRRRSAGDDWSDDGPEWWLRHPLNLASRLSIVGALAIAILVWWMPGARRIQ